MEDWWSGIFNGILPGCSYLSVIVVCPQCDRSVTAVWPKFSRIVTVLRSVRLVKGPQALSFQCIGSCWMCLRIIYICALFLCRRFSFWQRSLCCSGMSTVSIGCFCEIRHLSRDAIQALQGLSSRYMYQNVSLSGVNVGFWYLFSCLGQDTNVRIHQSVF